MNYDEEKNRYISYCGSYCHICDWHTGKIRKTYQSALDMLEEYGFKRLLGDKSNAANFKRNLQILANSGICSGCKSEVAKNPKEDRCKIRQCCSRNGYALCSECTNFPCKLLKNDPGVIKFQCVENLIELKKKGTKHWVDKQWKAFVKSRED